MDFNNAILDAVNSFVNTISVIINGDINSNSNVKTLVKVNGDTIFDSTNPDDTL